MVEWEHTEPGWYTHPDNGGVCLEDDGWWHYPLDSDRRYGPYRTAKACMGEIERSHINSSQEDT